MIGSREKLTGRVSLGLGAVGGELSTVRAVVLIIVCAMPVSELLIVTPVVQELIEMPAVLVVVVTPRSPRLLLPS
jgi:hypothetical protein